MKILTRERNIYTNFNECCYVFFNYIRKQTTSMKSKLTREIKPHTNQNTKFYGCPLRTYKCTVYYDLLYVNI